jgi:16S rRNA (guanine966-N2)-methyltransferase
MRIIGGLYKGRRLGTVRGTIRPTSDRLRESLFDVLGTSVHGSSWLDLFAGSGAVGLEALSRGARQVVFNDRDPEAIALLKKNLALCGIEIGYQVRNEDAFVALRRLAGKSAFDFIFLDPPYGYHRYRKLLERVTEGDLCGPETTVILEIFKKQNLAILPSGLEIRRTLEGGDNLHLLLATRTDTDRHGRTRTETDKHG